MNHIIVTNPATGETIAELATSTSVEIAEKYARARTAQKLWGENSLVSRMKTIRCFGNLLVQHQERLAQLLTSETGKPITQSRAEIKGVGERISFFLTSCQSTLQDEVVLKDEIIQLEEKIEHEPLGVIANISAWNYPYFVSSNVFLPALLAGNAVLFKPSEHATLSGIAMAELLHQAGIPQDAFIPIVGAGNVGSEILTQPIDGIFFTGSYSTGRKIAETCGPNLIKAQFELGGKDPVYVCDDVALDHAVTSIADGAFYNTGQGCCSVERIYVHKKIYDTFVTKFVATVASFEMGDPRRESTYLGPLTRAAQIDVLKSQIEDAKSKGAQLLCGGKKNAGAGNFFEATVISNCNHSMTVMREESFGPIVGIQAVTDDEEAVNLMNDTQYGLTASVYTPHRARAERILKQVNSGSVYWNCCDRVSPRLPWSGRGHSGSGLTLSTHGLLTMTRPKAWHFRAN